MVWKCQGGLRRAPKGLKTSKRPAGWAWTHGAGAHGASAHGSMCVCVCVCVCWRLRAGQCPAEALAILDMVTQARLYPPVARKRFSNSPVHISNAIAQSTANRDNCLWSPIGTIVRMDAFSCDSLAATCSTARCCRFVWLLPIRVIVWTAEVPVKFGFYQSESSFGRLKS